MAVASGVRIHSAFQKAIYLQEYQTIFILRPSESFPVSKKVHSMSGQFTHINESFTCAACGRAVPPRKTSCRNHCPFCLASKHVDINPGDRQNPCGGIMDAIDYEMSRKKGLILIFRCRLCKAITRNIAALDDPLAADDYDQILASRCRESASDVS
jgi:hypothetical protein